MASAPITEERPRETLARPEVRGTGPGGTTPEPEKPARSGGLTKWVLLLLVLLAVAGAVWKIRSNTREQAAQSQKTAAAADRPTPVQVLAVQQRTMPIYQTALGTVTAYYTVDIRSRVDGQLLQVAVREGQAVRKGQVLAEIDPKPYLAAQAQAEGQLTRDQATLQNASAEAARYTALYQAGVVSRESQQSQVSSSGQAQGSIQADQAAIQAAKVNVGYTRITSPINGVVGLRQVDPGNIVHAADTTALMVVTQMQPIAVIFTLPEDQLPPVVELTRAGRKLVVEAYDRSETTKLATGSLLTVDNQIDPTTGTVKAKAVFDNKDGALFPNQFVNIRLILQQRPGALVVPAAAIQTGTQGSFVYVVRAGQPPASKRGNGSGSAGAPGGTGSAAKSGTGSGRTVGAPAGAAEGGAGNGAGSGPAFYVDAQPVKVDITEGSQVILVSGVQAGDQIVVDGQEKLRDGARVIPRQGNPPAGGAGAAGTGGAGRAAQGAGATTAPAMTPRGAAASGAGAPGTFNGERINPDTRRPGQTYSLDEPGRNGSYGAQGPSPGSGPGQGSSGTTPRSGSGTAPPRRRQP